MQFAGTGRSADVAAAVGIEALLVVLIVRGRQIELRDRRIARTRPGDLQYLLDVEARVIGDAQDIAADVLSPGRKRVLGIVELDALPSGIELDGEDFLQVVAGESRIAGVVRNRGGQSAGRHRRYLG